MVSDKQNQLAHFVLIDDDGVSNMLAKNIIKRHFLSVEITVFTDPLAALIFIETIATPVVVLLDINMPTLSGWDVLEKIETFHKQTIDLLKIYIVSSSIDIEDHERAAGNPLVIEYLEKPVSSAQVMQHFAALNPN